MDLKLAEEMIKLMRSYGVTEMEMAEGESKIRVSTAAPAMQQTMAPQGYAVATMPTAMPVAAPVENNASEKAPVKKRTGFEVKSPFVGTFYAAPAPGEDDFVSIGQRVKKGETLCIVEAMKLMNEIEAEKDGVISEILIENESPVEFDQILFVID